MRNKLLLAALAALVPSLTPVTTAQGTCVVRNGSDANLAGFACTSTPTIGTDWSSTVDIATTGADASVVSVFLGGPLAPTLLPEGELLCAPPFLLTDLAAGSHSLPIPALPAIAGLTLSTQAAALTFAPFGYELQNAIDITIGVQPPLETITVLLIESFDSVAELATPTPVPGATIVLRGSDPSSSSGLTAITDASGHATFTGVFGPYDVSAQKDVSGG